MTEEEIKKKEEELTTREAALKEKEASNDNEIIKKLSDLEAEVKSFKEENDELKKNVAEKDRELVETKAMNFKLARQQSSEPAARPEEILYNLMFPKKEGGR